MTVTIENNYTGNNSLTSYSFTFPYLDKSDVKVSLDGVATTAYTWSNATTLNFNTAPGTGVAIKIYRDTAYNSPKATFYPGSAIRAGDLNDNSLQNLYVTQEANDKVNKAWLTGDPTVISSETWYTTDDTKIASSKAIENRIDAKITTATTELAVSSLADGAARQVLQTAANGSDVEWTSNVDLPGTLDVSGAATFDSTVTASTFTGDLSGNAATFTTTANNSANETVYPVFVDGVSGAQGAETDSGLTYNPSTGVLTATSFTGNLTGNVTGNTSGSAGSCTGNAATATALAAAATVTNSEQASHSVDDATFFTTSASDARYFNISSGDTIKDGDSFPDNDTTIATTAAINDRIVDLVDDVGGFVAIASENHFPNANPDVNNGAGTIVSIKALSENIVTGSGVTSNNSIAQTVGGTAVNITGLTQNTTYAAGFGMLVETTTTLNEYTFHRLTPKATEVTTVAGIAGNITTVAGISANVTTVAGISANVTTVATNNTNVTNVGGSIANVNTVASNLTSVNNFNDLYQIASSAPSTDGGSNSLAAGDLYFNTSSNELQVYTGSAWQGGVTATGDLVAKAGDTMTGNLVIDNAKEIRLSETDANGSHYLGFKAPDSVTANVTLALPDGAGSNGQFLKTNGSDTLSWSAVTADEGTAILSTGESGGTKFLREDGDGSCSWQSVNLSAYAPLAGATFTGAINAPSAIFTDDGSGQILQVKADDGAVYAFRVSNDTYSTGSLTGLKTYVEDDGDVVMLYHGDSEYTNIYIAQHDGTTNRVLFGGGATGNAYMYYQGSAKLATSAAGVTVTGTVSDSKGELRTLPANTQASTYTLVAADAGKYIYASNTVTLPASVFTEGQMITIVNNTAGDITLTASGITLYHSKDGATGSRTLGTRGMATVLYHTASIAYITGSGLS